MGVRTPTISQVFFEGSVPFRAASKSGKPQAKGGGCVT